MNKQIQQIAERLRGLRDSIGLPLADAARQCGVSVEEIQRYESGKSDIPMSFIIRVAHTFSIETSALISGEEPHATAFFLTRKGTGSSMERNKAYRYQSLAQGFRQPMALPFEVTVEPNDQPIVLNTHPTQEFNYVLEGNMQLSIAGNDLILNEGDSIYFDAALPHGMKALNGKAVKFLAIIF